MASNGTKSPLRSLKLFTHNVDRVLKPSQDGELAHAIHETLHYALDGQPQDYLQTLHRTTDTNGLAQSASTSAASATENRKAGQDDEDDIRPGFVSTNDPERPFISYSWDDAKGLLTLPHPLTVWKPIVDDPCRDALDDLREAREAVDVTVKFFYLQNGPHYPPEWIEDAMDCLGSVTGIKNADTAILAFPSLHLDCPHASDKEITQRAARVADVWRKISSASRILSMGLSDLSQRSLAAILEQLDLPECHNNDATEIDDKGKLNSSTPGETTIELANGNRQPIKIPSSPSQVSFGGVDGLDEEKELLRVYGPGPRRRPRLCTINLREQPCNEDSLGGERATNTGSTQSTCWDRGLAELCKEKKVLLVAHSDQKDILPARTLPTLLQEFQGRIPHGDLHGQQLTPVWCLKYTVLIRDRGILADKGCA